MIRSKLFYIRVLCLAILAFPYAQVFAENLYEVFSYVAQNHPKLKIATQEEKIAQAQKNQVFGNFYPSLDVSSTLNRSEKNLDYEKYELEVRQTLFDLNEWYTNDRQFYNQQKVALEKRLVRDQLILEVAQIFTEGLIAKQNIDLSKEQRSQSEFLLKKSELSFELGAGSDLDIQRAKSELYLNIAQLIEAKNRYQLSLLNLSRLANHAIENLNVHETNDDKRNDVPEEIPMHATFDYYWQKTLQHSHEIKKEIAELNINQSDIQTRRSQYWPKIDVVGSMVSQENHGVVSDALRHNEDTNVAIEFTWNLFQGFKTNAAVDEQKYNLQKTESTQQNQRLDFKQNIQRLVSEIYNNQQQYFALKNSIRYRELSYEQANRKWQLGMEELINVQKEKVDLFESKRQAVELNYKTWLAYLELKSVVGILELDDLKTMTSSLTDIKL